MDFRKGKFYSSRGDNELDEERREYFKGRLLKEKNRLKEVLNRLSDEKFLSLKESTGELSSYDNHPSDQASNTFEREMDRGLRDNTVGLLELVEDALQKIDKGEFGTCQKCGKEISEERLEAIPCTNLCKDCKGEEETFSVSRDRPVEEEVIGSPFGRGFNDDTDRVIYDAEDAWQDVAQYGTSNTTSDVPEIAEKKPDFKPFIDANENLGVVGIGDSIYNDEVDDLEEGEDKETTFTGRKGYDDN